MIRSASIVSFAAISLAAQLLVFPGQGKATTLPATSYQIRLTSGGVTETFDDAGPHTLGGVTGQIGNGPPSVSASSTNGTAKAQLTYYWTVNGPSVSGIPIDISYNTAVSATQALGGTAMSGINVNGFVPVTLSAGNTADSASGQFVITVDSGAVNFTSLGVQVTETHTDQTASAFFDPIISIDPSFFLDNPGFNPSDFSLSFSDGINNSLGAVPEPSVAADLIAGFLGLIALQLRRRGTTRAS